MENLKFTSRKEIREKGREGEDTWGGEKNGWGNIARKRAGNPKGEPSQLFAGERGKGRYNARGGGEAPKKAADETVRAFSWAMNRR